MEKFRFKSLYSFFKNKLKFNDEEYKKVEKEFLEINLKTGDVFFDFGNTPDGILFIISGEMRLIGIDDHNELVTIEKYGEQEIVGAISLLQGITEFKLSASTEVIALFMDNLKFLDTIKKFKNFQNYFNYITKQEYYILSKSINLKNNLTTKELLKWSEEESIKKKKVISLGPGKHIIKNQTNTISVSSSNIKNKKIGDKISNNEKIEVVGKFCARLISHKIILPSSIKTKNSNQSISISELKAKQTEKNNKKIKSLEDYYGLPNSQKLYPKEKGTGQIKEAMACIRMISLYYKSPFRKDLIKKVLEDQQNNSPTNNFNIFQFAGILDLIGFQSSLKSPDSIELLGRIPLPAITIIKDNPVVIWEKKNNTFLIGDPRKGERYMGIESFNNKNDENKLNFLCVEKTKYTPQTKLGFRYFLPFIKKYKSSLFQVVLASFFVQLLALFNPLLIQQIIDAVVNKGSINSLNILGVLLIFMALSQGLLSSLRTYLFSDTTNRIDVALGKKIIHHLFRLPLSYFSKKQVGEVSSRISELEKIRNFLTGTALTVLLDSVFSVIYILIMLSYSVKLTFFALSVVPFFSLLTVFVSPIIKNQLRKQAEANAKVNSHLVETISGIETIKGQSVEMQSEWRWEKLYEKQVNASFKNTITNTTASSIGNFLQQISGLIVIWAGAILVLEGKLSLGQLIAFRILSSYVTNPLLRIASTWQNFQEISISINRLSQIVDHPDEIEITGEGLPPIPPIKGEINFESVDFSFKGGKESLLKDINLNIKEGEFIGIVGSSGSGKSTLLKLLMRLFEINSGTIKIDKMDISKVDLYSLRSQIGLVSQDSLLFDGTIYSNLTIGKPYAEFEEVVTASKFACAHEFIEKMPNGYNTFVSEKGSELSGGQRQRIAIARMIIGNPNLIILDEATSALDVDTEKRVLRNLMHIFKTKTILFISHRLNSLIFSDNIIVMHDGKIVEYGNHEKLMKDKQRYSILFEEQDKKI